MRVPNLLSCAILAFLIPFNISAQLSEADKTAAIQKISKSIVDKYVDAEKGGQLSSHLLTANYKGAFKKANTWDEFDEMVTKSLQQVGNDKHIFVKHDV
ncbi:MAG: hypothetical protein J7497_08160, partial [Chitinophagaceae bacterium]|nr:hypothetical protein [Chitinophagaceae bacterium]